MRKALQIILVIYLLLIGVASIAQPMPEDIRRKYTEAKDDSTKGAVLDAYILPMEEKEFLQQTAALGDYFKKVGDEVGYDYVRLRVNRVLSLNGDYANAVDEGLQLLSRFEERGDMNGIFKITIALSVAYAYANEEEQAIHFDRKAVDIALQWGNKKLLAQTYNNLGADFVIFNQPDSALGYAQLALKYAREMKDTSMIIQAASTLGEVYIALKQFDLARPLIQEALDSPENRLGSITDWVLNDYGEILLGVHQPDSAKAYLREAISVARLGGAPDQQQRGYHLLSRAFEMLEQNDSALIYYKLGVDIKDSLFSSKKTKQLQAIKYEEQLQQKQLEQDKIHWKNRIRTFSLIGGLVIFTVIALILYRNNRQKQQANRTLERTLVDLKSTQAQLIQSEKMASLGELTAGIAHEIQNPLNFVNNFSEVSCELISEMKAELTAGKTGEALLIAGDISQNLEKINHHGKRADAIVKSMLLHSRSSNGKKEMTDINALCDEYLRLSYLGLRAKDKSFDASCVTDFDPGTGIAQVQAQDLGRVLLNLLTNAFYAVNEKKKQNTVGYEPRVSVTTEKMASAIQIRVWDNGNGISQKVREKIFQPFFTTKPTGQGTGLGLSMSYDIITKGHGGELKVESKEGEFAEFTIILPI